MHVLRLRWMLILVAAFAVATAVYEAGAANPPSKKKPVAARPTKPQRTTKVQRALATTPATTPAPVPIGVAPVKPRGTDAPKPPSQDEADIEPTTLDPKVAAQADTDATATTDEPAADAATGDDATAADTPAKGASTKPAAPATDADRYDLQYKFQPGEVIRTEVTHRATVETTIKGTTQTAETRTTSIKIWHINPTSTPNQFTFIHGVESIDMWQHTKGREEVSYNSETDKTPPLGYEDVAKAVGVPLSEVVIDARGNVLKRKELHQQSNANPAPVTMPLPEKPVALGESWTHPLDLDVMLANGGGTKKIQARQKFTLENVKSGIATIQVDSDALTAVNDPAIEAQLIQRMPTGTIRFDIDEGRVIAQQMDVDKRVIGFNGPASSMHYLSRFNEEFKSATPATASRAKPRK